MKSLNRKRLTQLSRTGCVTIRRSPPRSGRIEIEDEACPGLVVRITPRNVKTFSVIYRVPSERAVRVQWACGRLRENSTNHLGHPAARIEPMPADKLVK